MKFVVAFIAALFVTIAFCNEFELKTIEKCATCRGSGKITCPRCKGSQKESCGVCHGRGYTPDYRYGSLACMCGNGKVDCYNCREFGVFPTGKVICPDCKGKKYR